jgi:hypothetical protein
VQKLCTSQRIKKKWRIYKMGMYSDLKRDIEKKLNEVPMFFAFSDEQLYSKLEKRQLGIKDIYRLPSGGFIAKTDIGKYHEWLKYSESIIKEIVDSDSILLDAFKYELDNHEYFLSGDTRTVVEALGLDFDEVKKDDRIFTIFKIARREHLEAHY